MDLCSATPKVTSMGGSSQADLPVVVVSHGGCNDIVPWYDDNAWCMFNIVLFYSAVISKCLQQVSVIV